MGRMSGKVAAVTGGASGIGEATVRLFLEQGATVAFADQDRERGERLAGELATSAGQVLFVHSHMELESEAVGFIESAVAAFGRLDVLVNNAGIRKAQNVTESSTESWLEVLSVNLIGYAHCAKAAIVAMRGKDDSQAGVQRGGSIVCVASVRSVLSGPNAVLYDASKAGVLGLMRGMAHDHALEGIRVNAVGPGPIMTPFHERRVAQSGQNLADYIEKFGADTMLKRPGTAREVANGIAFLASDEASYITGTCLYIDGGQTAL